ncbi:SGNH/GDSL hydrolase family protein [Bradyrhizobium sp. SYSU BS000235]|uniref:SGNH/GDSL hydrolase family protein n=1 Tax=Bradyrhizobium sp. SYSU BS000235 TaxID=3411332 RepID=UPI003C764ECC
MHCLKLGSRIGLTLRAPLVVLMLGGAASATLTVAANAQQPIVVASTEKPSADNLNAIFKNQACIPTKALTQFDAPLTRTAKRLNDHEPVTIVAIGSSSTGGAGASSPRFAYPSRLERELRQRYPDSPVTVINRGVNGEDAADMMARLDEVLAPKPDLVIWQLGTNTVLRGGSIPATSDVLQSGIARIKATGADVLLIDPQFAPSVNAKPAVNDMVGMIGLVGKQAHVPVFRRYVAMQHWHDDQSIPFDRFIIADGLHMNDWGYSCLARLLADDIATVATRSRTVAGIKAQQ